MACSMPRPTTNHGCIRAASARASQHCNPDPHSRPPPAPHPTGPDTAAADPTKGAMDPPSGMADPTARGPLEGYQATTALPRRSPHPSPGCRSCTAPTVTVALASRVGSPPPLRPAPGRQGRHTPSPDQDRRERPPLSWGAARASGSLLLQR
uniref:Uncharacterized protein n=1 Tax=Setaria viridis TaxID=4556 RepID=A0A4U6VGX0_SETVI|nr:hypothetical protein SEVIR_3G288900v2 [Setaria viridis]